MKFRKLDEFQKILIAHGFTENEDWKLLNNEINLSFLCFKILATRCDKEYESIFLFIDSGKLQYQQYQLSLRNDMVHKKELELKQLLAKKASLEKCGKGLKQQIKELDKKSNRK